MRNKRQKIKQHLPSTHTLFRLSYTPSSLTPLPLPSSPLSSTRGMGSCGLRSAHNCSSLLLILPHTYPLFQCRSSPWSTVLNKPVPSWTFHALQLLQEFSTCSVGFSMGCSVDICSGLSLSVGFREIFSPLWSFPQAEGETLGVVPGAPSFSSLSLLLLTIFFLTPQCCVTFCLFLSTFSQRCHYLGWGVQLCRAVSPLEPSGYGCFQHGAVLGLSLHGPALQLPLTTSGHLHSVQMHLQVA